ncbi:MAG: F0F1 ATP synthase subunit epsilon [Thiogranum sp.]|jgi:F-type H+-transporting ATPase subunit epsilon
MKTFTLRLLDATRSSEFAGVSVFVGEDSSGGFGILAGHARLMTTLVIGLARFRVGEQTWQYLALPGAVLYFDNDVLTLSTRHFLLDDDYMRISAALREELLAEEEKLHAMKESLHHMEEAVLKRLWEMGRERTG